MSLIDELYIKNEIANKNYYKNYYIKDENLSKIINKNENYISEIINNKYYIDEIVNYPSNPDVSAFAPQSVAAAEAQTVALLDASAPAPADDDQGDVKLVAFGKSDRRLDIDGL